MQNNWFEAKHMQDYDINLWPIETEKKVTFSLFYNSSW